MKLVLIAVVALVAVAVAAPQGYPAPPTLQAQELPKVIRSEFDQQANGGYIVSRMTSTAGHRPPPKISTMASFETENGIQRQEKGELKKVVDEENKPQSVVVVKGSYSYIDSEGNPLTINYYVDETGFHAEGDAIPKTPFARR